MRLSFKQLIVFFLTMSQLFTSWPFQIVQAAIVSGTEGMTVYGKGGDQTPFYKIWDGTAFGAEAAAQTTAVGIKWVLAEGIPRIREEKLMGVISGGSNTLYIQRWNGTSWSIEWSKVQNTAQNRNFAIAYEQFTGNAIVIYGDDTTQLKYRKWDGSTWTGELNAGAVLDSAPTFVNTASRPPFVNSRQNDILVMVTTSGGKLHALRWNAGAWVDQVQMTNNPAVVTSDVADAAYERTTGDAMVVWGTAANEIVYRKFTLTGWGAETVAYSGLAGAVRWIDVAGDRLFNKNNISVIWNDTAEKVEFAVWNGTSWETRPTNVATDQIDRRNVSTGFEKHTGKALFAFAKKSPNGKVLSWRSWDATNGFSAVTSETGELAQKIRWLKLRSDSKSNNLMLMAVDIGGDLHSRRWDGNGWSSSWTDIVVGLSSASTETFDFFWDDTASDFLQTNYRWYADNDLITPTDAWPKDRSDYVQNLGENTSITLQDQPPASTETLRLRLQQRIAISPFVAGEESFRLQFAQKVTTCSAIAAATWADVGNIGSASIWRGINGTPLDGAALSTDPPTAGDLKLTGSDHAGTYEEENPSALNPFAVPIGEEMEHDWFIQNNGALTNTSYCFRMVNLEGLEGTYNFYPELKTSGYRARSQNWRWYNDETNETPVTALAAENVAPQISDNDIVKLRATVNDTAAVAGVDIKFKLQYSEYSDFSQGVTDVVANGSCGSTSKWCYADGVDADDAVITTRVLTDSTASGRHNESGTTTSTFDPVASTPTEFEFTLKHGGPAGTRSGSVYFFRLYDTTTNTPALTNTGETYPSLTAQAATLSFSVAGLASGTVTEGVTTDVTTTATTIPFGTWTSADLGAVREAAQRLTVSTNAAEGYQIFVSQRGGLKHEGYTTVIPSVTGTNASPTAWATGCSTAATGCFGYHAGDDDLLSSSTRFAVNDTYASLETNTLREIAFASSPITNEITDIIFKLKLTALQSAGPYELSLVYVIVPSH